MDVQGSRFHLLHGRADWGTCLDVDAGRILDEAWEQEDAAAALSTAWEYDDDARALRLRRDTPLFRQARRGPALVPDQRRGADAHAGAWYWIDADRRGIRRRPPGAKASALWWSVDDLAAACTCDLTAGPGGFAGACTCGPVDVRLAGLCITTHAYLLAGYAGAADAGGSGLLVFDLRAGGAPLRMPWRDGRFDPFDLAATGDGGALVLDRTHGEFWRLDEHLRLRALVPQQPIGFAPVGGGDPVVLTAPAQPVATPVLDAGGALVHPVSIAEGPGGAALLLESDPARGHSRLLCCDDQTLRWEQSLENAVEVIDPDDPAAAASVFSVLGHDVVYLGDGGPVAPPALYIADSQGDQVVAFDLDVESGALHARDDFLPLRRWPARALVAYDGEVWYDFDQQADTRWVSLQVFTECRFASRAVLTTAIDFAPLADGGDVGGPFDSRTPACVWHRLFLDLHLPTGTSIAVRARASDDAAMLALGEWRAQPTPYLRSAGSELPYDDPWVDRRGDVRRPVPLPEGMGTYELLFQQVTGRYLQLELTVTGSGRATPLLRSLRAWFPRFSYPEHYLPEVYTENDAPGRFLERFLANPEGQLTALEERIEHSHVLLDARTAPRDALEWLAAWFGLALAPQWDEARRRFLIRNIDRFYRLRGTPAGLTAMLRVYLDAVVDDTVFCGSGTAGGVRIVERFLMRDVPPALFGAPVTDALPGPRARARQAAHRFDVLVPVELGEDRIAMVQRIIDQARPAHTAYRLRRYYELFIVGHARLGIDSELGDGMHYGPAVVDQSTLAASYLAYPYPFDILDRVVSDRDTLGALPAL